MTIRDLIADYQKTGLPARAWLTVRNLKVYVRITRRYIAGDIWHSLDVASAEVPERHRGKGAFTRWMDKAEALAEEHRLAVFAESILEPQLIAFFKKRGYMMVDGYPPPSMFKLPPDPTTS